MAKAWRRLPAMPEPSGCGGAASPCDRAPVIFEVPADHMGAYCNVDDTGPTPRVWFIDRLDFFNLDIWLGDEAGRDERSSNCRPTSGCKRIATGSSSSCARPGRSAGRTYAPDTVLGMSLSAFLAGDRNFTVVFEPGPRRALQGLFWTAGKLVLSILDELRPVFEVCTPSANGWTRERLPGLPEIGVVDVWRLDRHESESNGDLLANMQDPLTPPSLMLIEGVASPAVLKQAPQDIFRRRARGHAARGDFGRRRAHSLCADRACRGDRRCAGLYERLWRLRPCGAPSLQFGARQAVAGARRHHGAGQHPRRRRVRHALARCRPLRRQAARA